MVKVKNMEYLHVAQRKVNQSREVANKLQKGTKKGQKQQRNREKFTKKVYFRQKAR